jgi:hypothetical protein
VEHVRGGDDAHHAAGVHDGQGPDEPISHQVGCLPERRSWFGGDDPCRHEVANGSTSAQGSALATAEVSLGDHPEQLPSILHQQVANASSRHSVPRGVGSLVGADADDVGGHELLQAHASPPRSDSHGVARSTLTRKSRSARMVWFSNRRTKAARLLGENDELEHEAQAVDVFDEERDR